MSFGLDLGNAAFLIFSDGLPPATPVLTAGEDLAELKLGFGAEAEAEAEEGQSRDQWPGRPHL